MPSLASACWVPIARIHGDPWKSTQTTWLPPLWRRPRSGASHSRRRHQHHQKEEDEKERKNLERVRRQEMVKAKLEKGRMRIPKTNAEQEREPSTQPRKKAKPDQEDSEDEDEDPRELLARALDNMTDFFDVDTIRLSASQMTTVKNIAMGAKLKGTPRAKQTARSAEKHGSQAEKQVPQGGIYPEWIMNPNEPPCQFMTQSEKRAVQEKIQMLEVDQLDILMDWVNSRFCFEDKNNIDLDLDELPPSQQKEVVKLVETLFENVSRGDPKPEVQAGEGKATGQDNHGCDPVVVSKPGVQSAANATSQDSGRCERVVDSMPEMTPEMTPQMRQEDPMQEMAREVAKEALPKESMPAGITGDTATAAEPAAQEDGSTWDTSDSMLGLVDHAEFGWRS